MLKKKNSKTVLVCPNCGGTNVQGVYTMNPQERTFFNIRNKMFVYSQENIDYYGCKDCGYYGPVLKVKKEDLKKVQADVKNRKHFSAIGINAQIFSRRITSLSLLVAIVFGYLALIFRDYYFLFGIFLGFSGVAFAAIYFHFKKNKNPKQKL